MPVPRRPLLVVAALCALMFPGAVAGASGASSSAPASTTAAPAVTVLEQDAASVAPKRDANTAKVSITLLNQGAETPISGVALATSSKAKVDGSTPDTAAPGATPLEVTLSGLKDLDRKVLNGQLVVTLGAQGGPQTRVARAVKITPAIDPVKGVGSWFGVILIGTLLAFVGLLSAAWVGGDAKWDAEAPGPKWSFDSWGTTLTTVGAALGTVLGAVTFPDVPDQISKDSLVQLNVLFGVLVLLGPFTFQVLRGRKDKFNPDEFYGTNATLLISCGITGAAVLGEITTLGLLGWELAQPSGWGAAMVGAALVVFAAAAWYFFVSTRAFVRTNWKQVKADADAAAAKPQEVVIVVRHPEETFADVLAAHKPAETTEAQVSVPTPVAGAPRASWPLL